MSLARPSAPTRAERGRRTRPPGARRAVEHPAAAATDLYDIVSGPIRPARILGVFRSAVYLEPEGATPPSSVLAVLAHDAVRLPNGVVLAVPQSAGPFTDVAEATPVRIGRRCVVFDAAAGPRTVRVGRWWRPRAPRPAAPTVSGRAVAELASALRGVRGGLGEAVALLDALPRGGAAATSAAARLVGRGPGLTPSGDDAVCGFLLAARHLGGVPRVGLARSVLARAPHATTALSATLLAHAARGQGSPQAVDLLDALGGHVPLAPALEALRAVGHTSGTDLALGVLAAAQTPDIPSRPADRERP